MIPLHFCKPRVNFQQKKDATACQRATTTFFSQGVGDDRKRRSWTTIIIVVVVVCVRAAQRHQVVFEFFSLNLDTTNKEAERHISLGWGGKNVVAAVFCIDVLTVAGQRGPYTTTGMTRRSQRPEEQPRRHTVPLHLRLAIYEELFVFIIFFPPFTFFAIKWYEPTN